MSWPELWEAARDDDVARMRRCLARGDEVDGRGGNNMSPLMEAAARHTDPTALLLLLHHGADMEAYDEYGMTALHRAAWHHSANSARVLTALGAHVNAVSNARETPVMLAARWNCADTASALLEAGADLSLREEGGDTALDLAEGKGSKEVVSVIKDPGILHWGNNNMSDEDIQTRLQSLRPGEIYRVLLLNGNCLIRVPDLTLYPQLCKLKVVNMANNRITEVREEHLPPSVKTVYLGHNNIHTMSHQLISDWLHSFHLISNKVQSEKRQLMLHPNPIVADLQQKVDEGVYDIYGSFHNRQLVARLPDLSHMEIVKEVILPYQDISLIDVSHFPPFVENINLNYNVMQSLPNMKHMKSMRKISLSNNKIVVVFGLPSWMQSIDMKGNPIHTLHRDCFPSEEVYELLSEALTSNQIDDLQQPPPQIFRRGYEAVIQYYDQADISRLANNYGNRLAIVGEALAGKTSLIQTLIHGVPCLTGEEDRTEVVKTHTWRLPGDCTYQVFDQGGHKIYDITNRYFLSSQSKNLICHNIKEGSIRGAKEMLKNILHQFPNGHIHFGLTKLDLIKDEDVLNEEVNNFQVTILKTFEQQITLLKSQKKEDINVNLIKSYENRKKSVRFFPVSSLNVQGLSELKSFFHDIAKENRQVVPKHWLDCLENIQKDKKPFLKLWEYQQHYEKCYDNEVKRVLKYIRDPSAENQKCLTSLTSLRYFSDCGLVIWYEDHPKLKGFVFHNIQYLISLMKCVFRHNLEDHLNYDANADLQKEFNKTDYAQAIDEFQTQGLMSLKLLNFVWKDEFAKEIKNKDEVLELMKYLDICHEVFDKNYINDEKKYFFPWFVTEKKEPCILRNMFDTDNGQIMLNLECTFFMDIPINVTEQMIVNLQRLAYEEQYFGERKAWKDGLYISDGDFEASVLRRDETHSLQIYLKDEVNEIFAVWKNFHKLKESLLEILSHWHGIVERIHIPCFHCVYVKRSEPYLWPLKDVFGKGRNKVYTSCSGDTKVPAALVTMINTGDDESKQTKHIQAVKDFLSSNKKESSGGSKLSHRGAATTLSLNEPHSSQSGILHLQNQERQLGQTLQVKGTFVLRQLLQKQVLDTWGHELELLLQDISAGVIVKTGPTKEFINKFQDQIYRNKLVSLFEGENTKLKGRNIEDIDITLISKLLRVPKISGIEVTQKRWNDFQKGSIEDMLHPKKPGPPGRQEEDESTHAKLAGLVSVIVHLRNNVHNKTDRMNLNKDELEISINYLSHVLTELMKYLGISEQDIIKHNATELFYSEPYTEAMQQLTAAAKSLQRMTGKESPGSVEKTSTGLANLRQQHSHPQQITGPKQKRLRTMIEDADDRIPTLDDSQGDDLGKQTKHIQAMKDFLSSYKRGTEKKQLQPITKDEDGFFPPQDHSQGLHGTAANYKLTPQESQFVLDQIVPSICRINIPGFSGTGFVLGALPDRRTGHTHRYVLTCYHIKLFAALRDQQHCEAQFDRSNVTAVIVKILQPPLYWSQDLDFVLVKLETSQALDNSLAGKVSMGELVTVNIPAHNDALVLCAHTDKQQIDWGARGLSIDHESVRTKHGDLTEINVKRQRTYRDPHIYPISRRFILYQCSCQAGTSGAPCLSASQTRLFAMHCGSVYNGKLEMSPEYGVLLKYVVHNIHKKISNPSSVAGTSYMQQGGLQLSDLYSLFPNVPRDLNPADDQVSTMQLSGR